MRGVIFAGPSLPPKDRPTDASLDWRPPARQGDVYKAALERPSIIGIIDGYFEITPSVWHKEILWAMAEGVHVFGAASIGALRAAELDRFGMRGTGRIYADYQNGALVDDDEVAVLHGPAELGYPPVTEAMVDIRATLAAAVKDGVLAAPLADRLTVLAKSLFYKDRTYAALLGAAAGGDDIELAKFDAWLRSGRVHQKRRDALKLVAMVRRDLAAELPPLRVDYRVADTAAWRMAKRRAEEELAATSE
jgi:hypothetical protein